MAFTEIIADRVKYTQNYKQVCKGNLPNNYKWAVSVKVKTENFNSQNSKVFLTESKKGDWFIFHKERAIQFNKKSFIPEFKIKEKKPYFAFKFTLNTIRQQGSLDLSDGNSIKKNALGPWVEPWKDCICKHFNTKTLPVFLGIYSFKSQ